jgi:hypothetical protein
MRKRFARMVAGGITPGSVSDLRLPRHLRFEQLTVYHIRVCASVSCAPRPFSAQPVLVMHVFRPERIDGNPATSIAPLAVR